MAMYACDAINLIEQTEDIAIYALFFPSYTCLYSKLLGHSA